ncbi:MAG: metallophosphoesterase [Planctomycetaceae bacterium]|nr:metallophosphoesterase [Planctomycetaceae bacterium]
MFLTRSNFLRFCAAILVLPLIPSLFAAENNASWSFGIMPDTQWKTNVPFHGTAIHVIDAINAEFIRHKVEFVIQVGDLVETPSRIAFQTRATRNRLLDNAGIKFYPVRGNHDADGLESIAWYKAAFPNLPGTLGASGNSPNLPGAAGMTYSFTHKGGTFILLDTYPLVNDGSRSGKAYTVGDYLPWIESELKKSDHQFALVFAHENLRGQSHRGSNLFGNSGSRSNPELQNAFIGSLQQTGVRYFICGHDHMYHRSRLGSPDGQSEVIQIICGNASDKSYVPYRSSFRSFFRGETPIAQDLHRIGFMIVRVENNRIRFEYYSTEPFGDVPKTPTWELRDSFEYTREYL